MNTLLASLDSSDQPLCAEAAAEIRQRSIDHAVLKHQHDQLRAEIAVFRAALPTYEDDQHSALEIVRDATVVIAAENTRLRALLRKTLSYVSQSWGPITAEIAAALDGRPANTEAVHVHTEQQWRPTHRHIKRGSEYQVLPETAELQGASSVDDDTVLVLYKDQSGYLWARPWAEFYDGRFAPLPTSPEET